MAIAPQAIIREVMSPEEADLIRYLSGSNRALRFILLEVVRDLARSTTDPKAYLDGLFERTSAKADHASLADEAHPETVEFRLALADFFAVATKSL